MYKLLLRRSQEKQGPGYQLKIQDKTANLQDLMDEMDGFIASGHVPRLWPEKSKACLGCHLCCHEPLPLTSIDVVHISRATHRDFMESFRYLQVDVQGPVVDITLKRPSGDCIFLSKKGTCKIYTDRPFLCHTYICCYTPQTVEELRSQVVNQGMDELVRLALNAFDQQGKTLPTAGSCKELNPGDWLPNCFTGKDEYSQLHLQEVLSSALLDVLLV